ncbi:Exocyst complex component 1 [Coelomomyces lativittatus]|nr:Exocyst complex component 1 [Coelomomyces lativittatus]KAJ1502666.1 Exocyst complex component 1 [Coelomomyces lativittatus]
MFIENTYFLYLELKSCELPLLQPHYQKLELMSRKHMDNYVHYLLKKAFSKLQDFFMGIDHLLMSQTPEEVMYHIHYNRNSAKKILSQFPSKEVHKCLDYCAKKIQKHISEPLVLEALWKQLIDALDTLYQKIRFILSIVYKDDLSLQLEFSMDEIRNYKLVTKS